MSQHKPILPGATIGVLGSGQLGRMLAIAARQMGYHIHVLSPATNTPTGAVADLEINAAYDDLDAISKFAQGVDVVTYEFENVPAATASAAAAHAPLRPGAQLLAVAQNRIREKSFFADNGLPVSPFHPIRSRTDLDTAINELGYPTILKTATSGYDGKGQYRLNSPADVDPAWQDLNGQEAILEAFVPFKQEVSIVAARGLDGHIVTYGLLTNDHENHILDVTYTPSNVPPTVINQANQLAHTVLTQLDVVGVLCIEMFLMEDNTLLLNEIAPRPHNSGHLTVDACVTSQFEQQLRAICGLPLGDTRYHQPAAMANLLGDLWQGGTPNWHALTQQTDIKLHLYGKKEARPGRKMGHITVMATSAEAAVTRVRQARNSLTHT
ncbi:MAG TPA: 5-(carboxyamino)imidazole ribonucleotide synthase [Anaerolineae bacterium]|nr:5-(carboxyamino)imidazole ribonucleotide synthase [Anaerolineae bacterium]